MFQADYAGGEVFFLFHYAHVLLSLHVQVFSFLLEADSGHVYINSSTCGCERPAWLGIWLTPTRAPTKLGNKTSVCTGTRDISSVLK